MSLSIYCHIMNANCLSVLKSEHTKEKCCSSPLHQYMFGICVIMFILLNCQLLQSHLYCTSHYLIIYLLVWVVIHCKALNTGNLVLSAIPSIDMSAQIRVLWNSRTNKGFLSQMFRAPIPLQKQGHFKGVVHLSVNV
ncbi:hypothetical protein XELAEV_18023341mg [Xenopus laevis]|uniref:Uncharacterized protein n=1 Tax=Xenopus laevis TaxID=8355 RepID=A0A974D4Z1_XENLA|nr:hypothetical protein XELAEV_18023341mg [Xenopus laevis]